ncbi:MAG: LuxR C-terminal-related transcriptional regulator [Candidatus Methylomirabilales bacterium]
MESVFDLLSNTADGVFAVDREQKIVLWNKAAQVLLGFTAREAVGRFCYEVIGGLDQSGCLVCQRGCVNITMALRREFAPTRDVWVRSKDGREIWLSVSTIMVPSRWRDLSVLVHLFRDVSRQKEIEHVMEQLLSSVAKLSLSQGTDLPKSMLSSHPATDLTRREREVLRLLASGASTNTIAETLCISLFTVRNHIHNILAKLGVHNRLEAVTVALRNCLV